MIVLIVISLILTINDTSGQTGIMRKARCLNPPRTVKKVQMHIKDCQDDVKNKIVKEAFELLRSELKSDEPQEDHQPWENFSEDVVDQQEWKRSHHIQRTRRSLLYHPTLVPREDKRIAGCLLHCVYAKNNAVDKLGWPTLDGLVAFYSEGVDEHAFFMATLRAVNTCLRATSSKYHINRRRLPEQGECCDLAFDVFDCISDQITNYCFDHYRFE